MNDTPVSPERNAAEISLENKVLAERLTGLQRAQSQRSDQSEILVSWHNLRQLSRIFRESPEYIANLPLSRTGDQNSRIKGSLDQLPPKN